MGKHCSDEMNEACEDFLQFSALNLKLLKHKWLQNKTGADPGGEIGDLSPLIIFNDIHRETIIMSP